MRVNRGPTQPLECKQELSDILLESCRPFFVSSGFCSLDYIRIYDNGSSFRLNTKLECLHCPHAIACDEGAEWNDFLQSNLSRILADKHPQEFYAHIVKKKSNEVCSEKSWNSLELYVNMNKFVEIFYFSGTKDVENIVEFYLNKKEFLQRFLHYFREKVHDFGLEKTSHGIDKNFEKLFINKRNHKETTQAFGSMEDSVTSINVGKFYLKTHDKFITHREAECLHYLALGYSVKEIGRILKISPRTVESYINVLKNKTDSHSKADLVNVAHQNYISHFKFTDPPYFLLK